MGWRGLGPGLRLSLYLSVYGLGMPSPRLWVGVRLWRPWIRGTLGSSRIRMGWRGLGPGLRLPLYLPVYGLGMPSPSLWLGAGLRGSPFLTLTKLTNPWSAATTVPDTEPFGGFVYCLSLKGLANVPELSAGLAPLRPSRQSLLQVT